MELVLGDWCELFDVEGMPMQMFRTLPYWIKTLGIRAVRAAVRLTSMGAGPSETDRCKYLVSRLARRRDTLRDNPHHRDQYSPQPGDPPWDGWARADYDCDHLRPAEAEAS